MSTELTQYDAVCSALDEITHLPDVKDIHDKAAAMQDYARRAKDPALIERATVARKRAEIKAGELLVEMAANGKRAGRGEAKKSEPATFKLSDLGVTKSQSSRWQQIAALLPAEQDAIIERAVKHALHAVEKKPAKGKSAPRERPDPLIAAWKKSTVEQQRAFLSLLLRNPERFLHSIKPEEQHALDAACQRLFSEAAA